MNIFFMFLSITCLHSISVIGQVLPRLSIKRTHFFKNYTTIMTEKANIYCPPLKKCLSEWHFSEPKLLQLPQDEIKENYVRRNVKGVVFSEVLPTPLKDLKLVAYSEDVLINILEMDPQITESQEFAEFITGNKVLDSSTPMAHRYGGHQFGVWAMQLGDGRAHLLGEYINSKSEHWELQLKGSGMTPYSRDGDGRAVLRSSVREFLCSEAMFYLGVPTSRAAALVVSRNGVVRDPFYNGFPQHERAAVVLRLAPTWFRFGSLELLARHNELSTLKILTDYIIKEHFSHIEQESGENKYLKLFNEVSHKTVDMVVLWQCVGFTHGVLNTDNMSLMSITIDYGPFGFLDAYHPRFVPNSSDREARYCYDKQVEIVLWNLEKLLYALSPLLNTEDKRVILQMFDSLESYAEMKLSEGFRKKLGLLKDLGGDLELSNMLLRLMEMTGADFTLGFRQLGEVDLDKLLNPKARHGLWALEKLASHDGFSAFVEAYKKRISAEPELTESIRKATMSENNPRYVLRNWMAQSAIAKAEKDDFSEVNLLLRVLTNPYTVQEEAEVKGYASPPPSWSNQIRVSCSS